MQVHMQLGTALTAAADHSGKSPVTHAALDAMNNLLDTALHDGICFNSDSTPSSMGSSIKQQLQQSGVLQQLASLMTALAADTRQEAAAVAAGCWDAASADIEQFTGFEGALQWFATVSHLHQNLRELWEGKDGDIPPDWMWGATGHADAAMQLVTAALQHVSAVVRHVLPVVREHAPQRADELNNFLQRSKHTARALCLGLLAAVDTAVAKQQKDGSNGGPLQETLKSTHMLTAVASVLVLFASAVNKAVAAHSAQTASSSASSSSASCVHSASRTNGSHARGSDSSSSSSPVGSSSSSSSHPMQLEQQQHSAPNATTGSSSSDGAPAACKLQLLQLLGLAPEMLSWDPEPLSLRNKTGRLFAAAVACLQWRV